MYKIMTNVHFHEFLLWHTGAWKSRGMLGQFFHSISYQVSSMGAPILYSGIH